MEILKFEQLPNVIADLKNEVKEMKAILLNKAKLQPELEDPLNIDEVAKLTGYSKPTIYLYCQNKTISFHKKNGRLFFFKSEIIEWIKTGKQKTLKELEAEADSYLSSKKRG
jgi:excisionase family DNA binding protein